MTFREVREKGSVRDLVWKKSPFSSSFHSKYSGRGNPLTEARIRAWGRHVLEGLNYLRLKGFPPGHTHCGNIIVENNICRLTDYENRLLNLPPNLPNLFYHPSLLKRGVDVDVISFGGVLFEMSTGFIMDELDLQKPPKLNSKPLSQILEWIFYPTTKEDAAQPPSIQELLELEFFKKAEMPDLPLPQKIDFGKKGKEILKIARNTCILTHPPPSSPSSSFKNSAPSTFSSSPSTITNPTGKSSKAQQRASQSITFYNNNTQSTSSPSSNWTGLSIPSTNNNSPKPPSTSTIPLDQNSNIVPAPNNKTPINQNKGEIPPSNPPPSRVESSERVVLLSSIESFKKGALKKATTNDRSSPIF